MTRKQKRPGRLAEEIVVKLEQALGPNVSVVSPEAVLGLLSGKQREIDIAIRGTVGSTDVFVMIECRDRRVRQGVEWIEQLVQKARDVGAGKVIAVSTSGFTKPAQQFAELHAVLLRTLDTIDAEGIARMFVSAQLQVLAPRFRYLFGGCTDGVPFIDYGCAGGPMERRDEPLFQLPGIPEPVSLNQIWEDVALERVRLELPENLRPDGTATPYCLALTFERDPVKLHLHKTPILLKTLVLYVEFDALPIPLTLADARQYKDTDGVMAQIARYEHHWPGGFTSLEIAELPIAGARYLWTNEEMKAGSIPSGNPGAEEPPEPTD
jgi:hypothetical protein